MNYIAVILDRFVIVESKLVWSSGFLYCLESIGHVSRICKRRRVPFIGNEKPTKKNKLTAFKCHLNQNQRNKQ